MVNPVSSLLGKVGLTSADTSANNSLLMFLTKFGAGGIYANDELAYSINTHKFFEVEAKFYPLAGDSSGLKGLFSGIVSSIKNSVNDIVSSTLGSFTSGESLFNAFIGAIAKDNGSFPFSIIPKLLDYGKIDQKNLALFIQSIDLPNIKTETLAPELGNMENFGQAILPTGMVIPENNIITLNILDTEYPLIENVFYPWMREASLPFWVYNSQPYTTATLTISFIPLSPIAMKGLAASIPGVSAISTMFGAKDNALSQDEFLFKYVFTGCKPTFCETLKPSQQPADSMTRQVQLSFNNMYIQSGYFNVRSAVTKIATQAAERLVSPVVTAGINSISDKLGADKINLGLK